MMILELDLRGFNVLRFIKSERIDLSFEPHHILVSYSNPKGQTIVEGFLATSVVNFKLREE